MADKLFLYIDILGFKDLVKKGFDINAVFKDIDDLNVHTDDDFKCIVFSDTILVYGADFWLGAPNQGLMWLIEFAQDLFYRLISKDVNIRAYITFGEFNYSKMKNIEAYYGQALIDCYEKERTIKCTGVFLDKRLASYCDIFHITPYDADCHFVHVMQHLDDASAAYELYPLSGEYIEATGMEWWVAYLLKYLENTYRHSTDVSLAPDVRLKHENAWRMLSSRHAGLTQRLAEEDFVLENVIKLDWTEPMRRIGTDEGAWG